MILASLPVGAKMMSLCAGVCGFERVSACAHARASSRGFEPRPDKSSAPLPLPPLLWQLRHPFC